MSRFLQILGLLVLGFALVVALVAGGFPWILAAVAAGIFVAFVMSGVLKA